MSANPIDKNSTPKPTGSLEELFRHHLGEEAAVPPRALLWDQIDNSLLIRQNEVYRRRLTVTRWVAAASLLLATLAGTGWWAGRDARLAGAEMAANRQPAAPNMGAAATGRNGRRSNGTLNDANEQAAPAIAATAAESSPAASANTAGRGLLSSSGRLGRGYNSTAQQTVAAGYAARNTGFGPRAAGNGLQNGRANAGRNLGPGSIENVRESYTSISNNAKTTAANPAGSQALAARTASSPPENGGISGRDNNAAQTPAGRTFAADETAAVATAAANGGTAAGAGSSLPPTALTQASAVAGPEQVSLLAARNAALSLANPAALPNGLASLSLPAIDEPAVARRWHFGASYTAGVFNPNVNFSRAGIAAEYDYNPALGAGSPAITEAAAAQYRANLRPGLSQRLALLATRHLTGHWSLSTGAEFSQATAKSASSTAFVGEQILDLGQSGTGPLHTTSFRYRTASLPLEVRYSNPVKRGWSLYGRLGGVVSALLGVRSDVEGAPEATKTYSLFSAGTPYRRVLGNLRGAAGAQFRSGTGNWALTLGPVAEIGLVSLNAHPVQGYFRQSRAYSFGLEAGMEFGR